MLGKILHINSSSDFKNSKKLNGNKGRLINTGKINFRPHDYSDISKASAFLQKTNWKLKKFNKSKNSLQLEFSIDEFQFEVDVDLENLIKINNLQYKVSTDTVSGRKDKFISLLISVETTDANSNFDYSNFEFHYLRKLFSRIDEFNITDNLSSFDSAIINTLLEGLIKNLHSEFTKLSSAVFTFAEIVSSQKLKMSPDSDNVYSNYISIEKISVEKYSA